MKADIILLTWNNTDYTLRCLKSIKNCTYYPYTVIWVDNGSSPESKKAIKTYLELESIDHQSIMLDENVGFPAGVNKGILSSSAPYVILLNNDTEVTKCWLTKLITCLIKNQDVGVVGAVTDTMANIQNWVKVSKLAGFEPHKPADEFILGLPHRCFKKNFYISYFCAAFRREVINQVGLLDEDFGIGLHEDTDYDNRLFHAGYKAGVCLNCFIHHKGRTSIKNIPGWQKIMDKNWTLVKVKNTERKESG